MAGQIEAKLLAALKTERASHAEVALTQPGGRDAFEFGKRCGYHAALLKAEQLLLDILDDKAKADSSL